MLDFTGVANYSCVWTSNRVLKANLMLSGKNLPNVGDSIYLKGGLLQSFCQDRSNCPNDFSSLSTVLLRAPDLPLVPFPIISAPSTIGFSDDLIIDTTSSYGDAGRAWKVMSWDVQNSDLNVNCTELSLYINTFVNTKSLIRIPYQLLQTKTTYSFQLNLGNFLDKTSAASVNVFIQAIPIPTITIPGIRFYYFVRSLNQLYLISSFFLFFPLFLYR